LITRPPAGEGRNQENTAVDQHATLTLVPARRAPRLARTFAAKTLAAWAVRAEDVQTVQLVVSELVTNAVLHAPESPRITLDLLMTGGAVRVMVSDHSPRAPQRRIHPTPWSTERGRGVELVDALASRWGTEPRGSAGKTVWCDLSAQPVTTR
jgi:anti-sigma regulatory factor (Ser/Thr protein kinase)